MMDAKISLMTDRIKDCSMFGLPLSGVASRRGVADAHPPQHGPISRKIALDRRCPGLVHPDVKDQPLLQIRLLYVQFAAPQQIC